MRVRMLHRERVARLTSGGTLEAHRRRAARDLHRGDDAFLQKNQSKRGSAGSFPEKQNTDREALVFEQRELRPCSEVARETSQHCPQSPLSKVSFSCSKCLKSEPKRNLQVSVVRCNIFLVTRSKAHSLCSKLSAPFFTLDPP